MTNFTHNALQQAVYERLSGHAPLIAQVTGIYDHVPAHTDYPYIVFGDITHGDWSSKTFSGTECSFRFLIFSRRAGRQQTAAIMDTIHGLLHHADISSTGVDIIASRFHSAKLELEPDGLTYRGEMLFTLLAQNI